MTVANKGAGASPHPVRTWSRRRSRRISGRPASARAGDCSHRRGLGRVPAHWQLSTAFHCQLLFTFRPSIPRTSPSNPPPSPPPWCFLRSRTASSRRRPGRGGRRAGSWASPGGRTGPPANCPGAPPWRPGRPGPASLCPPSASPRPRARGSGGEAAGL